MALTHGLVFTDDFKACWNVSTHSECFDGYVCDTQDATDCKQQRMCNPDGKGNDNCFHELVCSGVCVEIEAEEEKEPQFCDPEAKYDECEKLLGYGYVCAELGEKLCSYRQDCQQVKADECKEYSYENQCRYERGACKAYNQEKVCEKEDMCVEYKQEKKCDREKVCEAYHQKKSCKPNHTCARKNAYGKCVKYGEDCEYARGACKQYGYKSHSCRYVDTEECAKYEKQEVKCEYVNTDCKAYEQVKKCERVKGACKTYGYEEKCEQVEDVCQTGACKMRAAAPAPKAEAPAPPPKY
eukprot:evm.model.scf_1048.4 EVM.evm.TU.scf_1048.4   scf_1048:23994-25223(-)